MARSPSSKGEKKPYYEQISERLIQQLEEGTAPWQRPWEPGTQRMPHNPISGTRYRGANALWLSMQGRSDPRWMTYKQAKSANAQVMKGEKGTPVQYWKFRDQVPKKDQNGKPIIDSKGKKVMMTVELEKPKVFTAVVFNAEQIQGLPPLEAKKEPAWDRHERAEAILKASGATLKHDQADNAFYRPSTDSIHLPDKAQFESADRYYSTALHELGHWTGHPSRMDRDLSGRFGSESYAKEELRAEISSLMVGEELDIGHDPGQHAAYVKSWVKVLKEDPKEILRAARDAEKIKDMVLSFEKERDQQQDDQATEKPSAALVDGTAPRLGRNTTLDFQLSNGNGSKDPELGKTSALPFKLAEKMAQNLSEQDRARFLERVQDRISKGTDQAADIRIKEPVATKGDSDMER